ncbi:MAG: hypothetical protein WBC18_07950 [Ottowia sp.]|uniref:hypothetical protein n=1 Tax=Ottowia sp. TaxID=1898956 RepID=UPI003C787660
MSVVTAWTLKWGAIIGVTLLATVVGPALDDDLDPAPTDAQATADVAADLRDAIAQAQAERPDLWDAESKARAHAAIAIAARHTVAKQ